MAEKVDLEKSIPTNLNRSYSTSAKFDKFAFEVDTSSISKTLTFRSVYTEGVEEKYCCSSAYHQYFNKTILCTHFTINFVFRF